jgi:hypothetical protein
MRIRWPASHPSSRGLTLPSLASLLYAPPSKS